MSKQEQLTPEQVSAENELICERLLGWKQSSILGYWFPSPCHVGTLKTPSFDTWAEAGLILEAFDDAGLAWVVANGPEGDFECRVFNAVDIHCYDETAPRAVRFAALEYIQRQP